jgi:predicted phosphodiesterase
MMKVYTIDELVNMYNEFFAPEIVAVIPQPSPQKTIYRPTKPTKVPKYECQTTLVIPDCHVTPECKMDRFVAINQLIKKRNPQNIVILGDFLNLSSLSHWEKNNKLKMEGVRYKEDIDAGNNALDAIFKDIDVKKVNIIWHLGNHDEWCYKYLEMYPQLQGHIDIIADLKFAKRGITNIVPYKKYSEICGTLFTHAPMNAANQPIGGKFAAQKASDITAKSMVFGHTHSVQQYSCQRHGNDNIIQIYVAGSYFDNIADYADGSTMAHNFCISLLTHYNHGRFDVEQISKERMLAGAF